MFIVKHRKIFYTFSALLIAASIAALVAWGMSFSIDFTGGSSIQFAYPSGRPDISVVKSEIDSLSLTPPVKGAYTLVPSGANGYTLDLRAITDAERTQIVSALSADASDTPVVTQFSSIGPVLGAAAASKSIVAIILVILCIVLFITFAFRKVSEPVSSFKYGLVSILCLLHDITIPTGAFLILNHYFHDYQIDTLFVTAILVILGFSIHDTIVVFDRIRENLRRHASEKNKLSFEATVGASISQTFVRSVNTSLTTLLAILVVYLIGPAATKHFALALIIGIFFGTYSSIFIGSNLLVTLWKGQEKAAQNKGKKA
ncbi:MAG: protein translocase subunit SecF [Patescibacteria group bacterium]|nr:protein translocase subunit SecF [Patescibacteria group bacterium]